LGVKSLSINTLFRATLEWAEQQTLSILPGYRLPDTLTPIRLVWG